MKENAQQKGTNVPTITDRGYFPKVVATPLQRSFLYEQMIPLMASKGLIGEATWAEFVRWAIEQGASQLEITAPTLEKRKVGRKKKA